MAFACLWLAPGGAIAVTKSFTAAVSHDWMEAENWQPAGVPSLDDEVAIEVGRTATLDEDVSVGALELEGTLEGSGTLTVLGTLRWSTGTMRGSGTTLVQQGGELAGGGERNLGRSLDLGGATVWKDGGVLRIDGTGALHISPGSLLDIQGDAAIAAGPGMPRLVNDGTLARTSGEGNLLISSLAFHNQGAVVIETGTLVLHSSGVHTGSFQAAGGILDFSSGEHELTRDAEITGAECRFMGAAVEHRGYYDVTDTHIEAGIVRWYGRAGQLGDVRLVDGILDTQTSDGFLQMQTHTQSGGVHDGRSVIVIAGPTTWSGGEMIGFGITNANGGLTIAGNDALTLGRLLTNFGVGYWRLGSFLLIGDGGLLENRPQSSIDIEMPMRVFNSGVAPRVANAGVLRHLATGSSELNGVAFENTGTVELLAGNWRFTRPYTQTAGATLLNGGQLRVDDTLRIEGGSLVGQGRIEGDVTNGGSVVVGPGSPLEIRGQYTQGHAGRLQIAVGGTAAGAFGQLLVGSANLAGRLAVGWIDEYVGSIGDAYPFLQFTTVSGDFQELELPPTALDSEILLRRQTDQLRLEVVARDCSTPGSCVGTPTPSPSPTATATPLPCTGDCDANGSVALDDLIVGIEAALGDDREACAVLDHDASGAIDIDELVRATASAQRGC